VCGLAGPLDIARAHGGYNNSNHRMLSQDGPDSFAIHKQQ